MLTKKQLKVIGIFRKNIFGKYTKNEMKEYLGNKSNSLISKALNDFQSEKLVIVEKIGKNKLYQLNLENNLVYTYLELVFISEHISPNLKKSIDILKNDLDKFSLFYSLVVFGSHADNSNSDKSDLDIAVIVDNKSIIENFEIAKQNAKRKSLIELDVHLITKNELLEMLKMDNENLGKEIARKNLPIYNIEIFYKIIIEGLKSGFNL